MCNLYSAVKRAVSIRHIGKVNPWVTASSLCARKRPCLFPVWDHIVCTYLGIFHLEEVRSDWEAFRALVQDGETQRELRRLPGAVREAARDQIVIVEDSGLRLLDTALRT